MTRDGGTDNREPGGPSGPQSGEAGHLGDALSALLDGELSDAEAEAVRAHLAVCEMCDNEKAEIGQARSWLRGLPPVEPPADFFEGLIAGAPAEQEADPAQSRMATVTPLAHRHRRRRWAGVATISGCAAATLVVLGLVAPHDPSTSPPVSHFIEAHETAFVTGDPITDLSPAVVPVVFGR